MEFDHLLLLLLMASMMCITLAVAHYGSPNKVARKVDAIFEIIKEDKRVNDQREIAFQRLVGAFEQSVSESRRMAESCEQMAQAAKDAAEGSKESAAAAIQIQHSAARTVDIVDHLARRMIELCPEMSKA